jgi:hypothetical protein
LPSAFRQALGKGFAECQKALGKEKRSAKCKSEKIEKNETEKKIIGGGMHSQQFFISCQ